MYFKLKLPRKSGWYTQFFTTGWRSISLASSAASSAESPGTARCSSRMRVFSNGVYITTRPALAVARTLAPAGFGGGGGGRPPPNGARGGGNPAPDENRESHAL